MAIKGRLPRIGNERFRYAAILAKVLLLIYEETELEFDDPAVQEMAKQLYNKLGGVIIKGQHDKPTEKKAPLSIGKIEVKQPAPEAVKARGRNGYFVPQMVDLFKYRQEGLSGGFAGLVEMTVVSSRAGKTAPVMVRMTQDDWRRFRALLDRILMREEG